MARFGRLAWQYQIRGEELWLAVAGCRLPYILRKRVTLDDNKVRLSYQLKSTSDEPFYYLWSAHPLLSVEPGCRITLPDEVQEVLVHWSSGNRLGEPGDVCAWPHAGLRDGATIDLTTLDTPQSGTADKLFTQRLMRGHCAVHYPDAGETLAFHFDAANVPYIGIWICQGGWPASNRGQFTVALEPCTGRPDSLAEAISRDECTLLLPGQETHWELTIRVD